MLAKVPRNSFLLLPLLLTPVMGGSISGNVTNRATGEGIEGATVFVGGGEICWRAGLCAVKPAGPQMEGQQVVTSEGGAFKIEGLADGEYVISPSKYGFYSLMLATVKVSGDTRFDLQMFPPVSLRGRVLDPEGKPAEGIVVKLTGSGAPETMTNEEGVFLIEDVRPGLWKLSATPVEAELKDEERVVTTYYPSVIEPSQAQSIRVEDAALSGYDIRLRTARVRTIRGVVVDAEGNPEQNATVVLFKRASVAEAVVWGLPQLPEEKHLLAGDDGSFEFREVAEGDWLLRAIVPASDPETNRAHYRDGLVELRVERSDIADVKIRTREGFPVDISADWGDSPTAKPRKALVSLVPLDGQYQVDGEVFGGRYFIGPRFSFPEPDGFYTAAAMLDNHDVLGQVVELSGPTSLRMIYKPGGGSVRGTVESVNGAYTNVVLVADGPSAPMIVAGAQCDADGRFNIVDIPPGEYVAVAGINGGTSNSEILALLAVRGKRVTVEAGGSVQVELKVPRPQ
jgi:hypothetical protein